MADGIDAAMHRMEPPRLDPVLDRARVDAEREQLLPRDDAVLALREPRDRASRASGRSSPQILGDTATASGGRAGTGRVARRPRTDVQRALRDRG
jgi:hypothetical protein